jgi:hypothetical protein
LSRRITEAFEKRTLLPNPPVEGAAGGEADKSLRLPREVRSQFLWGQTQISPPKIGQKALMPQAKRKFLK